MSTRNSRFKRQTITWVMNCDCDDYEYIRFNSLREAVKYAARHVGCREEGTVSILRLDSRIRDGSPETGYRTVGPDGKLIGRLRDAPESV